jgi:hypothetical protein
MSHVLVYTAGKLTDATAPTHTLSPDRRESVISFRKASDAGLQENEADVMLRGFVSSFMFFSSAVGL